MNPMGSITIHTVISLCLLQLQAGNIDHGKQVLSSIDREHEEGRCWDLHSDCDGTRKTNRALDAIDPRPTLTLIKWYNCQ